MVNQGKAFGVTTQEPIIELDCRGEDGEWVNGKGIDELLSALMSRRAHMPGLVLLKGYNSLTDPNLLAKIKATRLNEYPVLEAKTIPGGGGWYLEQKQQKVEGDLTVDGFLGTFSRKKNCRTPTPLVCRGDPSYEKVVNENVQHVLNNISEKKTPYINSLSATAMCPSSAGIMSFNDLDTLLCHSTPYARSDGVHTSHMYVGTPGSLFPYHEEDGGLISLNYHHQGAGKFWGAVNLRHRDMAHKLINDKFGKCITQDECKDHFRHKVVFLDPRVLTDAKIWWDYVIQEEGDLVITTGIHFGFNFDGNINEAVNGLPVCWLPEILYAEVHICKAIASSPEEAFFVHLRDFVKHQLPLDVYQAFIEGNLSRPHHGNASVTQNAHIGPFSTLDNCLRLLEETCGRENGDNEENWSRKLSIRVLEEVSFFCRDTTKHHERVWEHRWTLIAEAKRHCLSLSDHDNMHSLLDIFSTLVLESPGLITSCCDAAFSEFLELSRYWHYKGPVEVNTPVFYLWLRFYSACIYRQLIPGDDSTERAANVLKNMEALQTDVDVDIDRFARGFAPDYLKWIGTGCEQLTALGAFEIINQLTLNEPLTRNRLIRWFSGQPRILFSLRESLDLLQSPVAYQLLSNAICSLTLLVPDLITLPLCKEITFVQRMGRIEKTTITGIMTNTDAEEDAVCPRVSDSKSDEVVEEIGGHPAFDMEREWELARQWPTRDGVKIKCAVCRKGFKSKQNLKDHETKGKCRAPDPEKFLAGQLVEECKRKTRMCEVCGDDIATLEKLLKHRVSAHGMSEIEKSVWEPYRKFVVGRMQTRQS